MLSFGHTASSLSGQCLGSPREPFLFPAHCRLIHSLLCGHPGSHLIHRVVNLHPVAAVHHKHVHSGPQFPAFGCSFFNTALCVGVGVGGGRQIQEKISTGEGEERLQNPCPISLSLSVREFRELITLTLPANQHQQGRETAIAFRAFAGFHPGLGLASREMPS